MPSKYSTPLKHLHSPSSLLSFLRHSNTNDPNKKPKPSNTTTTHPGSIMKMFKLFPLLTSGCKVVALLASGSRHQRRIADHATIGTLFGLRRGRMTLAIQRDPQSLPYFVLELPMPTSSFHKEMSSSDILRVALESETKSHKKKLPEEFVWAVYCNGRKMGYSIRRMQLSEDELHVMHMLRGVSMGAGVLPSYDHHHHHHHNHHNQRDDEIKREKVSGGDGDQITYLRARFERVVGSKDSEALYMINPDNSDGPELSIFFVRGSLL